MTELVHSYMSPYSSLHMISSVWIIIILLCIKNSVSKVATKENLKNIQTLINNTSAPFCYHSHSGTKQAYVRNNWKSFTGDFKAIIYPFCLHTKELGNRLGNYFTELACAEVSGTNFLSIHKQFDTTGYKQDNTSALSTDTTTSVFLESLPDIIVNATPLDEDEVCV